LQTLLTRHTEMCNASCCDCNDSCTVSFSDQLCRWWSFKQYSACQLWINVLDDEFALKSVLPPDFHARHLFLNIGIKWLDSSHVIWAIQENTSKPSWVSVTPFETWVCLNCWLGDADQTSQGMMCNQCSCDLVWLSLYHRATEHMMSSYWAWNWGCSHTNRNAM